MRTTMTRTSLLAAVAVAVAIAVIFAVRAGLALADQGQAPTSWTLTATDANAAHATWNAFPAGAVHTMTGLEAGASHNAGVRGGLDSGPNFGWSARATGTAPRAGIDYQQERSASVSLGNLADTQPTNRSERVDADGEVDYFHFWLSHQRVVRLRIRRLDYNADLYLENYQGTVIASRESAGDRKEVLNVTLAPTGADEPYYIRVEAREDGRNEYEFRYLTGMPSNASPSGLPVITGTAQVHETLSADTSGIDDGNGLTNPEYSYQWIRNDGSTDTNIPGTTGQTYILADGDLNKTVKVKVSFTDDGGYSHTLTSAATGRVARPDNVAPTGLPAVTGTAQVHETLSVDTSGISDGNGLSNPQYAYQWVRNDGNSDSNIAWAIEQTYTLRDDDLNKTVKVKVRFTDDDGYSATLTSAATGRVARPDNVAPTGLPAVTGTAQVHETLSVDTSGISDGNGLTDPQYSYQWIRNDGSTDTNIPGATGQTYILADGDLNKTVKVQVSFTDDDGYTATLTSAATGRVARPDNVAPTGLPAVTGTAQVHETLSVDTSGISDGNGLSNPQYAYQWVSNDGNSDSNIAWATERTYTLRDDDLNKTVKVKVSFTDDDGYSETLTSNATGSVARPLNESPTGLPTITGTPQVGETLTADTSGISDANGLGKVEYTYQWIRNDGNSDTNIPSAMGQTYTVTSDDQDNAIKVKVSFTDDDGYSETLTSSATGSVATSATTRNHLPERDFVLDQRDSASCGSSACTNTKTYSVSLTGGEKYVAEVWGASHAQGGDARKLAILAVEAPNGSKLGSDLSGLSITLREPKVIFRASSVTGTHTVRVRIDSGDRETSTFRVVVYPHVPYEDCAASTNTDCTVEVEGSVSGEFEVDSLSRSDVDWFKVEELNANQTYEIVLRRDTTTHLAVGDPYLQGVYNPGGEFLDTDGSKHPFPYFGASQGTADNNSGRGNAALTYFTPANTGPYFIAAASAGGPRGRAGHYVLEIRTIADDVLANDNCHPGMAAAAFDDYAEADFRQLYGKRLYGQNPNRAELESLYATASIRLNGNLTECEIQIGQTVNGYIDHNGLMTGRYSGDVVVPGDRDWFKVNLTSGTRYRIEVETRAHGMHNPGLGGIFDSNAVQVHNGNGSRGDSAYSERITFEPTTTGIHYIDVAAATTSRNNIGNYWLTITEIP